MGEPRIGDARLTQVQRPQLVQHLQVLHADIGELRTVEDQPTQAVQIAETDHSGVGDLGLREVQFLDLGIIARCVMA